MSMITRERCDPTLELPYMGRSFAQTTSTPQMGNGSNFGIAQYVDRESVLTLPFYNRSRKGCSDELEHDPDLIFTPMLTKYQQDDYRICHFDQGTRFAVKGMCINGAPRFRYESEQMYGGANPEFMSMYSESDI
uniref:Uncharacterized protein n=1 Tax=Clandestinovirus TaxID=2831644 RepID=A0A8F8KUE6_9VIRU|nr:hypothetical protein KOM_12_530 [Clandestinovirus]